MITSHAPEKYVCPLCTAFCGEESSHTMIKQADILYQDKDVFVVLSSKAIVGNEGHILVCPKAHIESIYVMPDQVSAKIAQMNAIVARALKEHRHCDGVTLFQNNEPAGGQHAFHYHHHIVPRWNGDLYEQNLFKTVLLPPDERMQYVIPIRIN